MGTKKKSRHKLLRSFYTKLFSRFGPQHWWPGRTRLEIIIGAILTQNTSWSNVEKAIAQLRRRRLLSLPALRKIPLNRLAEIIRPAGYYNIKAGRLKNFVDFVDREYGGSLARMQNVPTRELRQELLAVNGIGAETADSILLYAFDRPVFVVDAYTKRILTRHGLASIQDGYEDIQRVFTAGLPRDRALFNEYHALIVMTGKTFCRSRPRCEDCPLGYHIKLVSSQQKE